MIGEGGGPVAVGGGQKIDGKAGTGDGPGHSLAGEGFDITAGVANGQDAVAAETGAMARQFAGSAEAGVAQVGGAIAGIEDYFDQRRRPASGSAGCGVERGGEMKSAVRKTDESDIAAVADVHVDCAWFQFVRPLVAGGGKAHPCVAADFPIRPRLAGERCAHRVGPNPP